MDEATQRRRKVRNTAIALAVFALAVYVAFILYSINRGG